ncbi:hypothetical protein [uncultured Brevundimonas sp.]|uniref:hypothetical protein n=1 Tax=uncultured Brevundimonas sp. TaxID=213418 RepID=UPI0030EC8C7A
MVQQFSALTEVRKHPGAVAGVVAVLAGVGLAVLILNQRTGPTRFDRMRERFNPRDWVDTEALRDRAGGLADTIRHGFANVSERAGDFGGETRDRAGRWFHDTGKASRTSLNRHGKTARRYAGRAGGYARDHAKEGGTLLAIATIAAAIGAAALEARKLDDRSRGNARY